MSATLWLVRNSQTPSEAMTTTARRPRKEEHHDE